MLEIKKLNISFSKPIFKETEFKVLKGEIVAIDGESGSGKTTLLKYIINNIVPESGELYFQDVLITENNWDDFLFSHVSYVSQMGDFYPNMTIRQHFDFYSRLYNIELDEDIIKGCLESVNLTHVNINKSPIKLSTGERKRFLISLSLYMKKDIIILDEPTASIDYQSKKVLLDVLQRISKEGVTIIIATHDQSVLDISDNVFSIANCKLVGSNNIENKEETHLDVSKQVYKIKYRKYKNIKLKVLFIIILLIGSLCVSFISQTVSLTAALNYSQSTQTRNYKNNKLYLFKTIDPSNPFTVANNIDIAPMGVEIDVFSNEEIENIRKIDGVKNILPVVMSDESRQDIVIEVFKNNELLKKVDTKIDVGVDSLMSASVFITGYYPDEEITKDGKKISGNYINDTMKEILDIEDYENTKIKYTQRFPTSLAKNETRLTMWPLVELHEVTLPIEGVLSVSDYDDGRLRGYGRIFMPVQELETLMKQYYHTEGLEDYNFEIIEYQKRAHMIICEDGKDEEVKLLIEKMDPRYKARSDALTDKEYLAYMMKQTNSSVLMMSISSLVLFVGTTALVVYYLSVRKKEMLLLKNDGLKKNMRKYYREDSYIMIATGFIISLIILGLYYMFILPIYTNQLSKELFIILWICSTCVLLFVIYLIKEKYTKRYIERVD